CELVLDPTEAKPLCGRVLEQRPDVMVSVQAMAAGRPDAIAVSDARGELTYAGLLDRVRRLAGVMAERGIGRGARVGVCLERSRDLPVALLATLSTGAAYVPLDPSYPRQRLAAVIADSKPSTILVDGRSAAT